MTSIMPVGIHPKENEGIMRCMMCSRDIYRYKKHGKKGAYEGTILAEDFEPLKGVKKPKAGDPMVCPFCNYTLVYDSA